MNHINIENLYILLSMIQENKMDFVFLKNKYYVTMTHKYELE